VRTLPSSGDVAQLDLGGVIGDVRRAAGRGVDELEAAAAIEHEVWVALGAVGNEEQAELLVRLQVRGRIERVQVHDVAGLERPATRSGRGLPRQRIGVLDAREHDLGVADRAVLVDQIDPEHVLQARHLVPEGDDGIAVRADGQESLIDPVDAIRGKPPALDQLGKRLQIRHGELPDFRLGFVASPQACPLRPPSRRAAGSPTLRRIPQPMIVLLDPMRILQIEPRRQPETAWTARRPH
jgi:hypothetical protein